MLYHDSHDPAYRSPVNPLPCGEKLTLGFLCDESDTVLLRTWDGSEQILPMEAVGENRFEVTLKVPEEPMLFWYDFIIPRSGDTARYGNNPEQLGGVGQYWPHQPPSYQVTVYDPGYKTPEFLREGIMYQIFPDRFAKGQGAREDRKEAIAQAHPEATFHESWEERPALDPDPENGDNRALDFFGGTLEGIREKLPYLARLGVTVIYLNPVFRARTNHRYDTGDYQQIDPILGTEEDFRSLSREAEILGIHLVTDGVFSHTGADSRYFNRYGRYDSLGAFQSQESPYSSWYTFEEFPGKYRSWWGFYTLPAINKDNPEYRRYLLNPEDGVLPGWVKKGSSGWRLDVVDELPMDLVRQMRSAVKQASPDATLIGEVWEDASNKISYGQTRSYCLGDSLDSVMNYPLRRGIIDFFTGKSDSEALCRLIRHQREVYPAPFLYSLMNLLSSHDRVRALNAMAGYDREGAIQLPREEAAKIHLNPQEKTLAKKRFLSALTLICALPGIPCLYYGDEIGMEGMADPWNRGPMAWNHRDPRLYAAVKAVLSRRKASPMLQRGYLDLKALDPDTLEIRRYGVEGLDPFGQALEGEEVTVRISRK